MSLKSLLLYTGLCFMGSCINYEPTQEEEWEALGIYQQEDSSKESMTLKSSDIQSLENTFVAKDAMDNMEKKMLEHSKMLKKAVFNIDKLHTNLYFHINNLEKNMINQCKNLNLRLDALEKKAEKLYMKLEENNSFFEEFIPKMLEQLTLHTATNQKLFSMYAKVNQDRYIHIVDMVNKMLLKMHHMNDILVKQLYKHTQWAEHRHLKMSYHTGETQLHMASIEKILHHQVSKISHLISSLEKKKADNMESALEAILIQKEKDTPLRICEGIKEDFEDGEDEKISDPDFQKENSSPLSTKHCINAA